MRDHKYRAWEEGLKSMISFEPGSDHLLCFGDEKPMIQMFSNGGEFIEAWPAENIMEYINKKDKNGKEICESDILIFHDPDSTEDNQKISVVEWFEIGRCLTFFGCYGEYKPEQHEIIGNTYGYPD